jgi:secreted trypsin-like serine protease
MKRLLYILSALLAVFFSISANIKAETISTRIVGGEESTPSQWPYAVSLKYNGTHFCGGTLIAQRWVLTAAHCMYDSQDAPLQLANLTATVGEYDLSSSPATSSSALEQKFIHPDYDLNSQINDIALLKLATATDNEAVIMVDMPSTNEFITQEYPVTAIGWGSTVGYDSGQPVVPIYPDILNEVEVFLYTDEQCEYVLGTNFQSEVMICAGLPEGGKDTCQGDSGGPLMVNSNYGWQQIGITSWGYGCAAPDSPGVYTRLALYNDWLNKTISPFYITASTNFLTTSVNNSDIKQLTISNNSDNDAYFTYAIAGSEYFSFDTSACETIAAKTSCQFPVTYAPLDNGPHSATITVTSDISEASAQRSELYGKPFFPPKKSSGSLAILTILLMIPLTACRYFI